MQRALGKPAAITQQLFTILHRNVYAPRSPSQFVPHGVCFIAIWLTGPAGSMALETLWHARLCLFLAATRAIIQHKETVEWLRASGLKQSAARRLTWSSNTAYSGQLWTSTLQEPAVNHSSSSALQEYFRAYLAIHTGPVPYTLQAAHCTQASGKAKAQQPRGMGGRSFWKPAAPLQGIHGAIYFPMVCFPMSSVLAFSY